MLHGNAMLLAQAGGYSGHEIDNSAVLDGSSDYLSWTPGSAGDRTEWTLSMCFRVCDPGGASEMLFAARSSASSRTEIRLNSGALDIIDGNTNWRLISNKLFRDPGSFYHLVVRYKSDEATAADRVIVEVNGVRITSWSSASYPGLNDNSAGINDAMEHSIGKLPTGSDYFDGPVSDVHFIDGTGYRADSFGEFYNGGDAWRLIDPIVTYGTNGSHLDFADGGALGDDESGNANDWTVNGSPAQSGDSPTTNYPVFASLDNAGQTWTITDGGTTIANGNTGTYSFVQKASIAFNSGKYSIESKMITDSASGELGVGIIAPRYLTGITSRHSYPSVFLGTATADVYSGKILSSAINSGTTSLIEDPGPHVAVNDIIRMEINADDQEIQFYLNDVAQGAVVDYSSYVDDDGYIMPAMYSKYNGKHEWYFQESQWTDTPSSSDYIDLSAANLPASTGAALAPGEHFVSVIATEANIATTLATARSGWTDYIDIFKNRDTSESWYWRFSADSSNCFNSDSTDAKEAFPTLSGSNEWVGYSLRLNDAANIKGGSVSHTNGADTTVTHNAGNDRCMIILFPEAGGTRHVYHPDCTSGDLLYLDATTGETLDSAIKNVTDNGFDIDTGEATDTYWYLVIPETAGFVKLAAHGANASTNGPLIWAGVSPMFSVTKRIDGSGAWYTYSKEVSSINEVDDQLLIDDPAIETTGSHEVDFVAGGIKQRGPDVGTNGSGDSHVSLIIGQPFGGSNVPLALAR